MSIFKKWFNKANLQSFLLFLDQHPNQARQEYEFEPWFQYKIASPEKGPVLYFRKQPNKEQYKNGIFSKMRQYSGIDLANFLDHHYAAYPDKKEFVRFLWYEILERSKGEITQDHRLNLETALEWVKEQQGPLLNSAVTNKPPDDLTPDLPTTEDDALSIMQAGMDKISRSYAGKIALNNEHHKEKLIQVFILVQELMNPRKKAEQLFKHFSSVDLAAILRQLADFSNLRTNTLQGKITFAKNNIDPNDPKVQKLNKALTDFFYH